MGKIKDNVYEYDFLPQSMLPIWFVTDENLIIKNWNCFFYELINKNIPEVETKIDYLFLHPNPSIFSDYEAISIWDGILVKDSLRYSNAGMEVLNEIIEVSKKSDGVEDLYQKLNQIESKPKLGVRVYAYRPNPECKSRVNNAPEIISGIRISPPEGLELKESVDSANRTITYVDAGIACRFSEDLTINGFQVALHDSSERHKYWLQLRRQISQFVVHAFKSPLTNAKRIVNELMDDLPIQKRKIKLSELEALYDDVMHLAESTNFINSRAERELLVCFEKNTTQAESATVTLEEIREEVANAVRGVLHGQDEAIQQETAQNLIDKYKTNEFSEEEQQCNYLAEKVVKSDLEFFTVCSKTDTELDSKTRSILLKEAKKMFVKMMFPEVVINAVKNADIDEPKIEIEFNLNETERSLDISVFNNGNQLEEEAFQNFEAWLEVKMREAGNKRKPLGLRLNLELSKKLNITFRPEKTAGGTTFIIKIPYL